MKQLWCNLKSQCSSPVQFPPCTAADGRTALRSYLGASNPTVHRAMGKGAHAAVSTSPRALGLRPASERRAKARLLSSSLYVIANVLTQPGPDMACSIQKPDVMQLGGGERTFIRQGRNGSSDRTTTTSFFPAAVSTGFYIQRSFRWHCLDPRWGSALR